MLNSSTIRYRREQIPGADTEQIPGPEASDTQNTDTGALRIAPDTFMQILERSGQKMFTDFFLLFLRSQVTSDKNDVFACVLSNLTKKKIALFFISAPFGGISAFWGYFAPAHIRYFGADTEQIPHPEVSDTENTDTGAKHNIRYRNCSFQHRYFQSI